ncbi:MAG: DUF374 domain-containing protein [Verrucomicrobia bacterium]|nr:DUF374 domain-containing protein [Verrucomicrobiota bacterium]MBS0636656.1 DUF374 domain-containing protein [Verrucomicrobiota bacterium]
MNFFKKILVGYTGRIVLSLLLRTLRITIIGSDRLGPQQILAAWHDKLLLVPLLRRISKVPCAVVVSNSRDGKLLGALIETYRNTEAIYVAHNKRHAALNAMQRAHDEGKTIIITPDGPRGPRHKIKPGLFFIENGERIWMNWTASSSWKLNTWDKMEIPKPFAKVTIEFDINPPL